MSVMRFQAFAITIALAALVMASGCIFNPNDFTTDVVNVNRNEKTGIKDVLAIEKIETIPRSSIYPDMDILLFFNIVNLDDTENVYNMFVELFDPFIFKNKTKNYCSDSKDACLSDVCNYKVLLPCSVLPLGVQPIRFELKAPSNDEIAGIRTAGELQFRVLYDFNSSYNYQVLVVHMDEILKMQVANKKIEKTLASSRSGGPVQIYAEMRGRDFMVEGSDAAIIFTIKDAGSTGNLKNSEIANGSFVVMFPSNVVENPSNFVDNLKDIINCSTKGNEVWCNNIKEIKLYDGESSPLIFNIKSVKGSGGAMATYLIKARASYTYEIRDKAEITIVAQ
ncbi:MAG: hypothetical protein NT129_00115 [Candidatus Aenigmarchaeota archaeon]|nr:hypothetical protein [Candidatus Aenigmarchaeota archaeon]